MKSRVVCLTLSFVLAAVPLFLVGCSSGSSGSSFGSGSGGGTQDGSVNLMVSDASTDDWATIGVKILSISLIPQGGGNNVSIYSASGSTAPMINLVQLDQLGEILGNVTVPVGTYTGAVVTISGNPSDIQLTSSADPSAGLLALTSATTTIPAGQIQVQNTTGSAGSLTVAVTVNFVSPLVVTASGTNALDLEFDLSHPAFLIGHMGGGSVIWAVNFNGPLHHHPIPDLTKFLLRDIYGTVTSVNSDGSVTITRDFPVEPAAATASAEALISTTHSITIFPDTTNGTLFYDVDNSGQNQTIKSYSTVSSRFAVVLHVQLRIAAVGDPAAICERRRQKRQLVRRPRQHHAALPGIPSGPAHRNTCRWADVSGPSQSTTAGGTENHGEPFLCLQLYLTGWRQPHRAGTKLVTKPELCEAGE